MLRWIRSLAAPMVAIALLGLAPGATHAVPITFSTSGVFTAAGTDSTGPATHLQTNPANLQLDFTGAASLTYPLNSLNVPLGSFELFSPGGSAVFNAGDSFALTITQTDPVGVGITSSTVVGSVVSTAGLDTGTLSLAFAPNPILINGIGYVINPFFLSTLFNQPGGATGTLTASVGPSFVPLPAAAWAGMALMGFVGANKVRRSRQVQV